MVKNNQDKSLNDNKLINLGSITVNRNPTSDNELSTKKYIDEELDKITIVRFNQTLQNYLRVSVRYDTYNFTKSDKKQITDTTIVKSPTTAGYLLQKWVIKCNDKNNNGKIRNFFKPTKTNSPTGSSGATSLPPTGDKFICIETSSNIIGDNVFCSFERTDIIQISNITFYYNRFSSSDYNLRAMVRFRIQLLLDDNTWSTQYTVPKNDHYSDTSTDWTFLNIYFTIEN